MNDIDEELYPTDEGKNQYTFVPQFPDMDALAHKLTQEDMANLLDLNLVEVRAALKNMTPTFTDGRVRLYRMDIAISHLVTCPTLVDRCPALDMDVDGKSVSLQRLTRSSEIKHYYSSLSDLVKYQLALGSVLNKEVTSDLLAKCFSIIAETLGSVPDVLDRAINLNPEHFALVESSMDILRNQLYEELVEGALIETAVDSERLDKKKDDTTAYNRRIQTK